MERPVVIGVVCCRKSIEGYDNQAVNELYLKALRAYGACPILLPADQSEAEQAALSTILDGVLLTGSHSNVAPHRYSASHHEARPDEARDQLTFSLIEHCRSKNLPLFGICRGFQEINVALGGSLHPAVYSKAGALDHREPETKDFEQKYRHQHRVLVQQAGRFPQWFPQQDSLAVNSLHNQGIEQLAPSLHAEAIAEDGLVEAVSLPQLDFFVGVQWHPEWQAQQQPISQCLFSEFIAAAKLQQQRRLSAE